MTFPIANRQIPWIILGVSILTIAGALFFEYVVGLAPCALCLDQRVPYYLAMPVALAAGLFSREANLGLTPLILIGLLALIYAVGTGYGGYHAGVEYKWWLGPQGCTGVGAMPGSIEEFQAQLQNLKVPMCDEIPWSLFGISLAGFNFFISLGLCALASLVLVRHWRATGVEDV